VLKASSLAVGAAFLLVGLASAALTPISVKTSTRNEMAPAADGEWFAWTKSRENASSPVDVWAQRGTERAFKVNPRNTQAYTGGIAGNRLVYQLVLDANRSDLRLFDLTTRRHLRLPRGVNTSRWECCGTISGEWLLHSRGLVYTRKTQFLLLRNLVTGEERVLDRLQNRNGLLSAGQVSGNYAVWARCSPHPRCQIRRYDIATRAKTILPVPTGKIVYSPSVDAAGTTYYARSNPGCGKYVELVKEPLAGGSEALLTFPNGSDVDVTYAILRPPRGPATSVTDVYFDRVRCGQNRWDIFRVEDLQGPPPPPLPNGFSRR
jgi:hypothetical protein